MEHDLVGVVLGVAHEAFGPVVSDRVGKDGTAIIEGGGRDTTTDRRVSLEAVLRVLVPEVKRAVTTGSAEGTVLGVKGYIIHSMDLGGVSRGRVAVAFEGEVGAAGLLVNKDGWERPGGGEEERGGAGGGMLRLTRSPCPQRTE